MILCVGMDEPDTDWENGSVVSHWYLEINELSMNMSAECGFLKWLTFLLVDKIYLTYFLLIMHHHLCGSVNHFLK